MTHEQAIRLWVSRATGIDGERVILANQDGSRPIAPFAEVMLGARLALGTGDAVSQVFDAAAFPGEEITQTASGQREHTATVRVFTSSAVGADNARDLLARAQDYLGLPFQHEHFRSAGIAVFDAGTVQSLPAILDTQWEGRATLTIRFYSASEATYKTTYVETADVEGDVAP